MTAFQFSYMCCWIVACFLAAILLVRNIDQIELFRREYFQTLLQPWKVASFLGAASGMILLAPYSGDPTWDYIDAGFMSVLTYLTAPWVMGVLYLSLRFRASWAKAYIAICVWMFSASWSYDLYLVIRDGTYPMTWLPNIFASSVLFVAAGLLWSLEWQEERGVVFGFTLPDWPGPVCVSRPAKVAWYALLFILFVAALMGPFFV